MNENHTYDDVSNAWLSTRNKLTDVSTESEKVDIIEDFISDLAHGEVAGEIKEAVSNSLLTSLAKHESHDVGKRIINKMYKQAKEEAQLMSIRGIQSNPQAIDLVQLLTTELDRLIVTRSTDAHEETTYSWYFAGADVSIETQGHHRDPNQFARLYFDRTGTHVRSPDMDTPWFEWIQMFIQAYLEEHPENVKTNYGPRTQAIDDLRDTLSSITAVTDPLVAYREDLIYLREVSSDTLLVPSHVIKRVLSVHEGVTERGLQIELGDARGHLNGNVKQTTLSDGSQVRWWRVDRHWVQPNQIDTERRAENSLLHDEDEWGMDE